MEEQLCDAIVVGFVNYGESDRIIRLLTPNLGLISAISKNSRSSKHRLAGLFEVGNFLQMTLTPPYNDLWLVKDAIQKHANTNIRKDLHKVAIMMYCCEVAQVLTLPDEPQPKLFALLKNTLDILLDMPTPTAAFHQGFTIKALTVFGNKPQLFHCAICTGALKDEQWFHPILGGGVHKNCIEEESEQINQNWLFHTPHQWFAHLNQLLHEPLAKNAQMVLPYHQRKQRSSHWLMTEILEHIIEKPLKSTSLLKPLYP